MRLFFRTKAFASLSTSLPSCERGAALSRLGPGLEWAAVLCHWVWEKLLALNLSQEKRGHQCQGLWSRGPWRPGALPCRPEALLLYLQSAPVWRKSRCEPAQALVVNLGSW